jgi:hypothetical protein
LNSLKNAPLEREVYVAGVKNGIIDTILFGVVAAAEPGYSSLDFDQAFLGSFPNCPFWFG